MSKLKSVLSIVRYLALFVLLQSTWSSTVPPGSESSMAQLQRLLQEADPAILEEKATASVLPALVSAPMVSQATAVISSIAGVKVSTANPAVAAAVLPSKPAEASLNQSLAETVIAEANQRSMKIAAAKTTAAESAGAATVGKSSQPVACPAVTQAKPRPPQVQVAAVQKPSPARTIPATSKPMGSTAQLVDAHTQLLPLAPTTAAQPMVKPLPVAAAKGHLAAAPASKPSAVSTATLGAAAAAAPRSIDTKSAPSAEAAHLPLNLISGIACQAASVIGSLLGLLGINSSLQPGPQATQTAAPSNSRPATEATAVPKPVQVLPQVPAGHVPKQVQVLPQGPAGHVPKQVQVLPQGPAGHVPMCEWRSDLGACWVGRMYLLAVTGTPKSFVSKLISAAAARDHSCSAFTTPQACNELAAGSLMCSWGISSGPGTYDKGCRSVYMAEWDAFAAQPMFGLGAAPKAAQALAHVDALMCPGSIAQKSQSCSSIYPMDQLGAYIPGICQRGAGCAYQPANHACVTSKPLQSFIASLDPRFVGTCSSVCYLKMLQQCHRAAEQPAAVRAAWCGKQPGCIWTSATCTPDVYTSKLDQWGTQIAAASQACNVNRDEVACAGAAKKGAVPGQPVTKRAAEWVAAPINTGAADAKCPF